MFRTLSFAFFLLLLFAGCSVEPLTPIAVDVKSETVDFSKDVKPILDKRCVSCHSCYNSPCQLKLSSYEGLDRGSSKDLVYLAERLTAQDPSRLFIDAQETKEWRKKGFFSVMDSSSKFGTNNSILLQILNHKMKNPKSTGEYHSEEDNTCAKDTEELADFLDKHPNMGMPYGLPALKKKEYELIKQWLVQGAKASTPVKFTKPKIIDVFEKFLNTQDAKHVMSARYIYEHLFLAHLSFDKDSKDFYELVRSKTPFPQALDTIPTVRPYDDPMVERFFYRFRKINSTIVYKTHMVYDLSYEKLERYKELFIEPSWDDVPHDVGYKTKFNSQPFKIFAQIPSKSRYLFLLDNSEYVIRTFIRGPVCKGQIALNVIHDHFWVMFMNPEYDLSLKNRSFLPREFENLRMPIEDGSSASIIKSFGSSYTDLAQKYQANRNKLYDGVYKNGLGLQSIYSGNLKKESAPFLTVYRHFNSASVHFGALGNLPRTAWVIDYPLFERIYYALVAGFDVYGNAGHQVSVRRYMNRLRVEGETNFINLLPKEDRLKEFQSWYINSADEEITSLSQKQSAIPYKKVNSKSELIRKVIEQRLEKSAKIEFDAVNYYKPENRHIPMPKTFVKEQDYIDGFRSVSKKGTAFIKHANGHNANLAFVRIIIPHGKDMVVSMVVNRWHDNVSFMFNEESRLDANKDNIDFIKGFIGSYPNYFFVVKKDDLPDFFDLIENYNKNDTYMKKFFKYSIGRDDKNFWQTYDWFVKRFYEDNPHEAGLFDLNRYYYKVFP